MSPKVHNRKTNFSYRKINHWVIVGYPLYSILLRQITIRSKASRGGYLLLILFFFTPFLNGQILPEAPVRELLQGNGGEDIIFDMVENQKGDVAAIGTASRGKFGGSDIFFFTINKKLELAEKDNTQYIGRSSDDGATFIGHSFDGRWLVAGYSEMPVKSAKDANQRVKYKGKRDGWFLILDEKGKLLREMILGTPEDDVFNGAFALKDGGFLLSGNSGKEAWVVRLDKFLKIVWEKKLAFHNLPAQIRSAVLTVDENLFFVGTLAELGENKMWLGGVNASGNKIFDKIFPVSQATEGTGIIEIDDEILGITGYHTDERNRENGFFCTIDHSGNLINYTSVGGREQDRLNDLTLLYNGDIALTGHSASFSRGARRISAWTIVLNKKGQFINPQKRDEQYYGSKMADAATTLLQRSDGSLVAAGYSSKKLLKAEQAWIFQLTPKPKAKPKAKEPRISMESVIYPNNNILAPEERAFATILLENNNKDGIIDAQVRVIQGRTIQLLEIGTIPPQSKKRVGIPIEMTYLDSKGNLAFEIVQDNSVLIPSQTITINKGKKREAHLVLKVEPPTIELNKTSDFVFTVTNDGTANADNVQLFFNTSGQLKLPPQYLIGFLGENETRRISIPATATSLGTASVNVRVGDDLFRHTDSVKLSIPIISRDTRKPEVVTGTSQPKQNFINAIWLSPNPDQYDRKEIVWNEESIVVQIKGISSKPLDRQHFLLELNGESTRNGAKFDEVSLKGSGNSRTFQQTLHLREGVNTIKAIVKNETGTAETEVLKIIFTPRKPNLHILAIGVPQADLKYTAKDGRDFVKTLTNTQNKAFQAIFADTLFTETNTTKTEILKTMRRLQYRYTDRQIMPHDVLVVFISSHGLTPRPGEFRIAAGDYDSPFMQETSLDFEKEIVNYLNTIGCAKLFFLDACHSGESGASKESHYTIAPKDINLIVSCQANEYSYEDDKWENGAFTKALIEGFEDFKVNKNVDTNKDNALDLQELFRYVERQVPVLVSKKRPKAITEQHPVLMTNGSRPLVLFSK